jgi:lactoylglutathione lyase
VCEGGEDQERFQDGGPLLGIEVDVTLVLIPARDRAGGGALMASKKKAGRKTTARVDTTRRATAKKAIAKKKAARAKTPASGLTLRAAAPSLTVNDLDQSLAFYRDLLGFSVTDRWEQEGKLMGVEISAGPVTFMLGQDDWKKGRGRVKGEGFRLYCDTTQDVDQIAARIKARGGTLEQEPRDESWGARALAVVDPDGFKITIAKQR